MKRSIYVLMAITALTFGVSTTALAQLCDIGNLPPPKNVPVVTQLPTSGGMEVWTILFPVVNMEAFSYSAIKLNPGDGVRVSGCGCVQTGGSGKTWKLYVNPSGNESNKYYHGTVSVDPGGLANMPWRTAKLPGGGVFTYVRLLDLMLAEAADPNLWIVAQAHEEFTLGYEDDNHGDNGYYRHDNGNDNQCKGIGGAGVTVRILRAPPAPPAPLHH